MTMKANSGFTSKSVISLVPDVITSPPGLLGDLTEYIYQNAHIPNRQIAFIAAAALLGFLMGNRYKTSDNLVAALYYVITGETGSGKTDTISLIHDVVLEMASLSDNNELYYLMQASSVNKGSTVEGIEDMLEEREDAPNLLIDIDEIGLYMQRANKGRDAKVNGMIGLLRDSFSKRIYNTRKTAVRNTPGKKKNSVTIRYPALSLIAATTPNTLVDGINMDMVWDGLINRLLLFEVDSTEEALRKKCVVAAPPKGLVEKLILVVKADPVSISYSKDAEELWFECDTNARSTKGIIRALRIRDALKAKKLAMVFAVSNEKEVISGKMAQRALDVISYTTTASIKLIMDEGIEDRDHRIIESMYKMARKYVTKKHVLAISCFNCIASYSKKPQRDKESLQETFIGNYPDQYAQVTLDAVSRGPKPQVICKQFLSDDQEISRYYSRSSKTNKLQCRDITGVVFKKLI